MRRLRRRWWLVGLVVLVVILAQFTIFNPVRDVARSIFGVPESWGVNIYTAVKNTANTIRAAKDLSAENSALHDQVLEKTAQIAELQSVQDENTQLRKDLGFAQAHPELKLSPAEVIGYSPLQTYDTVTINKGKNDGVATGQAVISQGFLVGRIGNVSSATSEVLLLANRSVLTPVQISNSQVTGILSGGISGLVVNNIPLDTKVDKGQLVVTSNLEGLYPAGIAVGEVEDILSKKEDIFLSIRVSSPVNTASLSEVYVVTK